MSSSLKPFRFTVDLFGKEDAARAWREKHVKAARLAVTPESEGKMSERMRAV